jgi:hypothetical protein
MLREVDRIFVKQPLNPKRGDLDPPKPPRPLKPLKYFGLQMMNLGIPPLPPNRPYR